MNKKLFGIVGLVLVAGVLGGGKAVASFAVDYNCITDHVAFNKATGKYEVTYGPYPALEEKAGEVAQQVGKRNYTGVTYGEFSKYVQDSIPYGELLRGIQNIGSSFALETTPGDAKLECTFYYKPVSELKQKLLCNAPALETLAKFRIFTRAVNAAKAKP
ncbi:MAG: hypothetical protein LBG13_03230 [Holosporales bacterium]|jgi:hypothetical protein|nr:hypothetical protein [Holosporales bacterium]